MPYTISDNDMWLVADALMEAGAELNKKDMPACALQSLHLARSMMQAMMEQPGNAIIVAQNIPACLRFIERHIAKAEQRRNEIYDAVSQRKAILAQSWMREE